MSSQNFDAIIIGGGQGAALARMLGEAGQSVAIVEKEFFGGTCVNRGCTPTKAHIASAQRAQDARQAAQLGVYTGEVRVDLPAIVKRTREIVEDFRGGVVKRLESLRGIEIFRGTGRFVDSKTVEIALNDGRTCQISAPNIVIATGQRTQQPKIEGLDEIEWFDSRTMLELETIPDHLLIVGGGYIAIEFAQMFARFGAKVTVAQNAKQILEHEDPAVAEAISEILGKEGIEFRFEMCAQSARKDGEQIVVGFENGDEISCSHLMLATGQTPNTDGLNLKAAGVRVDKAGHVEANEFLETDAEGVFALGDVKGGPAFTHISYDDARILRARLCENHKKSCVERLVPYVVFTDPQLGRIGLTEKAACEIGCDVRTVKLPMSDTARGIETGQTEGFLQAIVEDRTDRILGGAILAREGGEVMAVLQLAIEAKLPYTKLMEGIFAHPTLAESFNNLFLKLEREGEKGCIKMG